MELIRKNYKPEILICPKCNTKLKYLHSISAKTLTFTQGKTTFVKNLGYICPKCKDHIYVSQTALKFAFKGIHYSTKVCFIIYYYKELGYSRELICDNLSLNNVQISDRNISYIYNKMKDYLNKNYDEIRNKEYLQSINEFKQIRLSIDLISYNKKRLIIIRNQFSTNIIGFFYFNSINDPLVKETLIKYINKDLPITNIITIRKDDVFYPLLKSLVPNSTKFSSFLKL